MRFKTIFGILAAIFIIALVVKQVGQAIHRTFQPPAGLAQRDPATPAYQNGLTLLEISNVSSDRFYNYTDKGSEDTGGMMNANASDTGLWIKLPPNAALPTTCGSPDSIGCEHVLALTAHTSDGKTFPLKWRVSDSSASTPAQTILLAFIPAGYPNSVHWVDVRLDDKHGDIASWRITHLPPMQHILAPPLTPQTTFRQGGVQAVAHAYRGPDPGQNQKSQVILCDITGTLKNTPYDCELGHLRLTQEWEPLNYKPVDSGSTFGAGKVNGKITFALTQQPIYYNQAQPYVNSTHWVRLDAALQEFATYDETVTFHNLSVVKSQAGGQYLAGSQPETVTTPSGVTVTLVDIQHEKNLVNDFSSGSIGLLIRYPNTRKIASLPHSPLWRKHPGIVSVSVEFPPSLSANGSSYGDTEGTYTFRPAKPLPKIVANFPLIIRQRVDLKAVPMNFVLPVGKRTGF